MRLVCIYTSDRTSVECVYNMSSSVISLYCYHLGLLCHCVQGETVMHLFASARMLRHASGGACAGAVYKVLIVIVNSSDQNGKQKRKEKLCNCRYC